MIYFDEAIELPVKQEFFSIDGETRTLKYSMELRDFQTSVDPSVFQIPVGFRREIESRPK